VGIYPITCTVGTLDSDTYDFSNFVSGMLKIVYRWDGFLQPINDTAYQPGMSPSVFKAVSTIPVKFQLRRADGASIQASTTPQWLSPQKGSAMSANIDESTYSDPASSGSTYRWDTTGQQYMYNWSTKGLAPGFWYKIYVQLNDGTIKAVTVGLK
jgi:hypothetical protein